jgi:hypothetical protein
MKRLLMLTLTFCGLLIFSGPAAAATLPVVPASSAEEVKPSQPAPGFTVEQFLALTPKKFKEITGKKLNLPQRLALKMTQRKIKRMIKKGQPVDMNAIARAVDTNDFNIGGFLLGLILGPLGVVIALILKETGTVDQSFFRWSLYGGLIWLAIALLSVLILF